MTTHPTKPIRLSYQRVLPMLVCALSLCVLMAMATSPGSAGAFPFPDVFATGGHGAGQVSLPYASAVDQSNGTVWIADNGNHRVDAFSATETYERAFGFGVLDGAERLEVCTTSCETGTFNAGGPGLGEVYPLTVGVNNASSAYYVYDNNENRVEEFSASGKLLSIIGGDVDKGPSHPGNLCTAAFIEAGDQCGEGTPGSGPGEFSAESSAPIAVDNFGGPDEGDVFIGQEERIEQLNASGEFVSELLLPGAGRVFSLAVDASGDFFVLSAKVKGVRDSRQTENCFTQSRKALEQA